MPKLSIDQREVEVPPGATVLDAARKLGIDVPTLCHLDAHPANTSCLVCMVKVGQSGKLLPACGTRAEDGMEIESETAEVLAEGVSWDIPENYRSGAKRRLWNSE